MRLSWFPRVAVLAAASVPLVAHAGDHMGGVTPAGALAAGILHPLIGWDHLLAMVTVGALGATLGGRHRFALPGAFLASLVLGGLVAVAGVPLAGAEWAIGASVLVLGLYLAIAKVPATMIYPTVAIAAVFHGHAHLAEIPAGADIAAYGLGMLAATILLHSMGLLGAMLSQRLAPALVLRFAGGAVAAGGALLLGILA